MASHLDDIGFVVHSREEMEALITRAVDEGEPRPCRHGHYVLWSPGAGVQLWAQVDLGHDLVGFNPHFDGPARLRATLSQALPDEEYPLDGSLLCAALPDGSPPFVVDVPDAALALESLPVPAAALLQLTAFAHDLRCFADEAAFQANQAHEPIKYAANYFIPAGMFGEEGAEQQRPRAEALFAGQVLAAERRPNPVTGQPFWAMTVRSLIGELTVVAAGEGMEGEPEVGGIVEGSYWLSARVVTTG